MKLKDQNQNCAVTEHKSSMPLPASYSVQNNYVNEMLFTIQVIYKEGLVSFMCNPSEYEACYDAEIVT